MLEKQQQLYQRICAYELDDPSHEIGFLAHLMRANGWGRLLALAAIEEYRKFVFLALEANHQVTPSDQVDQVWHLHLLFSDAYWNDFCPRVLGRPLHHHPARGGQAERDRFHELYRATIHSYRQHFGEPPPRSVAAGGCALRPRLADAAWTDPSTVPALAWLAVLAPVALVCADGRVADRPGGDRQCARLGRRGNQQRASQRL